MRYTTILSVGLLFSGISGCGGIQYTPQQRKEMETKILEADKDLVMKAVISVFQDSGYTVAHTDSTTGIVNATSGGKTNWLGVTAAHAVTATIETWGEGKSKVRVTFVRNTKTTTSSWYGGYQNHETSEIISTPEMMQKVFADIDKEVFLRKEMNK